MHSTVGLTWDHCTENQPSYYDSFYMELWGKQIESLGKILALSLHFCTGYPGWDGMGAVGWRRAQEHLRCL